MVKEKKCLDLNNFLKPLELEKTKGSIDLALWKCIDDSSPVLLDSGVDVLCPKYFSGKEGEVLVENEKIHIGVGDITEKDIDGSSMSYCKVFKSMGVLAKIIERNFKEFEIRIPDTQITSDVLFGLIQALYSYNTDYYSGDESSFFCSVKLSFDLSKYGSVYLSAHAQCISRFLGDTPCNWMTPTIFSKYAELLFSTNPKVEVKVIDQEDCMNMGMNLFYSVAQGSSEPGKLLTLKFFNHPGSDKHHLALVGKGVCFDSGGISLKPSKNMKEMKCDMMGGSEMLAAFFAAVNSDLKINVTCTIPLVVNSPGGNATNPGDVFIAMNGKTVEIDNTDAEGRLILADSICYAQSQYGKKPECLMDAATLTGAIVVALGDSHCGFFCNNQNLSRMILDTGVSVNEPMVQMPLSKSYVEGMKIKVADLCNISSTPYGGSCHAAIFLNSFVEENVMFSHFDIAGIAFGDTHLGAIYGKEASGRPVRCFISLIEQISESL